MGLSSTGNEYYRRGDIAIAGLSNVEKVTDDVIVHDENFEQHVEKVLSILLRCRELGITLNHDKLNFAENEVNYVGFRSREAESNCRISYTAWQNYDLLWAL